MVININCPKLLSCFNFNVLRCQIRFTKTFYIAFRITNYILVVSINRIIMFANGVQVDSFNFHSIESFCNYIITSVSSIIIYYCCYYYCFIDFFPSY